MAEGEKEEEKAQGGGDPAGTETAGAAESAGAQEEAAGGGAAATPGGGKEKKPASKARIRVLDICYMALFVAIIAVCSWISIPIGNLKYTLQVLGVLLCGGLLGWKRGLLAVLAYILLGAVGVPVFSNFTSGLFSSATSGYIVGFLFTVLVTGLGYKVNVRLKNRAAAYAANLAIHAGFMALGVLLCYAFGTAWFMVYMSGQGVTLAYALSVCVVPYLWFDAIKIAVALILVDRLKRYVR